MDNAFLDYKYTLTNGKDTDEICLSDIQWVQKIMAIRKLQKTFIVKDHADKWQMVNDEPKAGGYKISLKETEGFVDTGLIIKEIQKDIIKPKKPKK